MPKKIHAMFLFAVMIAIVVIATPALVAATEEECPVAGKSCETPHGWTVTLLDDYPILDTNRCPGTWDYRYEVCKPGTGGNTGVPCRAPGLARVNLAVPDCCPDKVELTKAKGCLEPLRTFPVGVGDPVTKFERGDQFVFAARLPFWRPRVHERSFCANTGSLEETSICLDRRYQPKLDCCKIRGPACTPDVIVGRQSFTFGPDKWIFQRSNPSLKCPDIIFGCDKDTPDEECNELIPGLDIGGIIDTNDGEEATIIEAEGECIVWFQFGTFSRRCPVIGGKKYCR